MRAENVVQPYSSYLYTRHVYRESRAFSTLHWDMIRHALAPQLVFQGQRGGSAFPGVRCVAIQCMQR
jgi:hypothetical protein